METRGGHLWDRRRNIDGISPAHRAYLAAGGLGITVGDGQLPHYALENVLEAYYDIEIVNGVHLGFDYQFVANPAYNADRGPVNIFSSRLHLEF